MILFSIVAFVFGFTLVALGLIFQDKIGAIPAGLVVAVIAFIGCMRIGQSRKTMRELVLAAFATLLPVWFVPMVGGSNWQFHNFLPAMGIVTVSVVGGIAVTAYRERGKRR
jgi:threonine/homoserine efflux transporter RhtA